MARPPTLLTVLALVGSLLGLAEHARAQGVSAAPDTPVAAELSASSTLGREHSAWRAFDADIHTAWCEAAGDGAGGTLVVRFLEPVTVRALDVYGADPTPPSDDSPRTPLELTVTSDTGAVTISLDASSEDPTTIALPIGATRSLSFHLAPRPDGAAPSRCLSEVHLQLASRALVYGAPPAALAALPSALVALEAALRRCDPRKLARLARFPVGFRETEMADVRAYSTSPESDTDPRAYPRPRDLPCVWTVFPDDVAEPRHAELEGGIAPGIVRVRGGAAIAMVYWELAWRAHRWQLVSIDTVFFE